MKYKVIDKHNQHTRAEFLFDKFCMDKTLTPSLFVDNVKTAYYKYDSQVYNMGYHKKLKKYFINLFDKLEDGYDIVDIGAGTGETFNLVKDTNYKYANYYFVEPFKSMSDQFDNKKEDNITIVNEYFENTSESIKKDKPTVYILCGVLRTMDQISSFLSYLNKIMKKDDILFMPVEPNNDYFGNYYKFLKPMLFGKRVLNKIGSMVIFRKNNINTYSSGIHPLDQALAFLNNNQIVNSDFTKNIIYAVVYYNNFHTWMNLDISEEYNEGFFNLNQVSKDLNCTIETLNMRKYFYGIINEDTIIDKIMCKLFPNSGSYFSVVLRRNK